MRHLIVLLFLFISCKKDKAVAVDSDFVGEWTYNTIDSYNQITINSKSRGYNYGSGAWPFRTGDQPRKYYVKDSMFQFGRTAPTEQRLHIDTFPKMSSIIDTIGENFLNVGDNYMWLDGRIYIANN